MSWRFSDDPETYVERVWDLLAADPAMHTVPLTVAAAARDGFRWSDDPPLFGWWEEGGDVRGAVSMTPPHELLLAVVPDVDELVGALRARGMSLPGVNGRVERAEQFAAAWTRATSLRHEAGFRMRLYRLGRLRPPDPPPPGTARVAGMEDLELAMRWLRAFEEEAGVTRTNVEPAARDRIGDDRLWLWDDETGNVVSLAGRTPTVAGVARIAPVYTPPGHRRRGYGAAITAACTADALRRGAGHVVLFTDLANPTTNVIYQQIGFQPVGDFCSVRFAT